MRADRLVATVLLLQQRGRVTAAEVALETEVSVPTARRDLAALGAAGVPVYPQPGRGGGWQLVGGARTDLSGLTSDEARALFLVLGHRPDAHPALATALRKLTQALPATFRAEALAAAGATVTDAAGWGQTPDSPPDSAHRRALQTAIIERRRAQVSYVDRHGSRSSREISPWGLIDKDGVGYVIAGTDRGRRTFRLDRLQDVRVTGVAADRPDDLDLEALWAGTVAAIEALRGQVGAQVLVDARRIDVVARHFGRHLVLHGGAAGGVKTEGDETCGDETDLKATDPSAPPTDRLRATITAHTVGGLAEQLAGWSGTVHVVGPPEVRAELARLGRDLVERYG